MGTAEDLEKKLFTANMNSRQRWYWSFRMIQQISWMTKQGYSAEQIDDVIASEVMQEEAKETAKEGEKEADKEKQDVAAAKQDEELKAAKDAAQAAGAAAKNLFGGIGSALGQAVNKAQPATKVLDGKDSSKNVGFGDDR